MMLRVIPLLGALSLLGGCAAPLVLAGGAAATGIIVAQDRRTAGTMVDDQSIEMKVQQRIAEDQELLNNSYINITSYNGVVLITGEVQQARHSERTEQIVRQQRKVREVRNALQVGPLSDSTSRNRDTLLTSRVKSRLINSSDVNASSIKVVSENATVYLMGLVSRQEAELAVQVTRNTNGVARIVKVFEYTS